MFHWTTGECARQRAPKLRSPISGMSSGANQPLQGSNAWSNLVGTGKLIPRLGMEADWREIGEVAQALIDRQFPGKAVLHVSEE
jgi:hypothetical protein